MSQEKDIAKVDLEFNTELAMKELQQDDLMSFCLVTQTEDRPMTIHGFSDHSMAADDVFMLLALHLWDVEHIADQASTKEILKEAIERRNMLSKYLKLDTSQDPFRIRKSRKD